MSYTELRIVKLTPFNYVARGCEYVNKFIKNSDGSIDFVSIFYSGGTDFYEELQDGLDALLNEENKDEYR